MRNSEINTQSKMELKAVSSSRLPLTKSSTFIITPGDMLPAERKRQRSTFWQRCCLRAEAFEDKDSKLRALLRELVVYLIFLFVLCYLVFSSMSVSMYHYTKIMTDLFINKESHNGVSFRTIGKSEDFWEFALGPLLDGLYWDQWYNKQDLKDSNISGYIYYQNKLLGLPRLRQIRVKSSECLISSHFKLFIQPCYSEYSSNTLDKKFFGQGVIDPNITAWFYRESEDIDGFWFWGLLARYTGSGFVQDLPLERIKAEKILKQLYSDLWIQRGTRIVFITFTVYNANVNLFSIIRLSVEFPATGGALPSWSINTLSLIQRESNYNIVLLTFQIIFLIFIAGFTVEEIIQIKVEGLKYFKEFWNYFDILLILLAIGSTVLYVLSYQMGERQVASFIQENQYTYADFVSVGFWKDIYMQTEAVTAFVGFMKVFKYIGFNKTMVQLSLTLSTCAKDLAGFFIMFFIVFLAFTQLGYLLFGSQLQDFSGFMSSFYTLFRIILGDFNFHQLEQANSLLGPIFFMLFVFFVFFVLINMFLAIINDTYSEIKSDVAKRPDVYIISDYLKKTYVDTLSKLSKSKDKIKKLELAAGRSGTKQTSTIHLDDWKANLYMQGFTDAEIKPIFLKYNKDGNKMLDSEEKELMLKELMERKDQAADHEAEKEEQKGDEDGEEMLCYAPFLDMSKRVDRMEDAMTKLVFNVEQVLTYVSKRKLD